MSLSNFNDGRPPQASGLPFSITTPKSGQTLTRLDVIQGVSQPCAEISVRIDRQAVLTVQANRDGRWSVTVPIVLSDGSHEIFARETLCGCCRQTCIVFTLENQAPLAPPTIESPAYGAVIEDRQPVIFGHADPGNIVTVCLSGYGCQQTTAGPDGAYQVQFPVALPDNDYTVTAVQQDRQGNVSEPAESVFTVSVPVPLLPPTIVTPQNESVIQDRQPIISGEADPGNTVTVCLSGYGCQQTVAGPDGVYQVQFPVELPNGDYTVTAVQQDPQGRVSEPAESIFTVDAPDPLPPPTILTPPNESVIQDRQPVISGEAVPGNTVTVCLSGYGCRNAVTQPNGRYEVQFPDLLPEGTFTITATQADDTGRVSPEATGIFTVASPFTVPPPTIDSPANGEIISDPTPAITGSGEPGYRVRLCVEGVGCQTVAVDDNGRYSVQFPDPLPDAVYQVTAVQINNFDRESTPIHSTFQVATASLLLEPLSLTMGPQFRTIEATYAISGVPATATIYYLLLPPGAPAPTPEEMTAYPNTEALENGTAARGVFQVTVPASRLEETRLLTGRQTPAPLALETGAVDGYVYNAYFYAVITPEINSGVVAFSSSAMSRPFGPGSGTTDDPYQLRELSQTELTSYPDLLAGHPINDAGVDRTARMLENIERLEVLFDATNGLYGMDDSLAFSYLLTTGFDLAGYAPAYDGDGWRPIGDYDASHGTTDPTGRHIFTGRLIGQAGGTVISNLPLTPRARDGRWVAYVGLIGYAVGAVLENITLQTATIAPEPSAGAPALWVAALAAFAQNCTLTGIAVNDGNMSLAAFGSGQAQIRGGGVSGEFQNGRLTDGHISRLTITGPGVSYHYIGGFFGYANTNGSAVVLSQCTANDYQISGFLGSALYTGSIIGLLTARDAYTVRDIQIDGVRIEGRQVTGGGAIGYTQVSAPVGFTDMQLENVTVDSAFNGFYAGGAFGDFYSSNQLNISGIHVNNATVHANYGSGGIVGNLWAGDGSRIDIGDNTALSNVTVESSYAGGMLGSIYRNGVSGLYIHDCTVLAGSTVTGAGNSGGFIGDLFHTSAMDFAYLARCQSAANVYGGSDLNHIGGLVGYCSYTALQDCAFSGTASGYNLVGGILGGSAGIYMQRCTCTGSVAGATNVGGLMGNNVGTGILPPNGTPPFATRDNVTEISSMRGTLLVKPGGENIGGLIGFLNGARLEQCFSLTNIDGVDALNVGLLAGSTRYTGQGIETIIVDSFSDANLNGNSIQSGGIVGDNLGEIRRCYSAGSIIGGAFIGGIAGAQFDNPRPIAQCFALGQLVSSQSAHSARIATGTGTFQNNFAQENMILQEFSIPVSHVSDPNGRDGQDIPFTNLHGEMLAQGWSPTVWDFSTIFPHLVNNPI